MQNNRVFCNFVKSKLQNHPFSTTFLVSPTKSSTFAPALEICKFFSIAFAIYGVKLLLTHLAEIARWVFLYINIKAGNDTRFLIQICVLSASNRKTIRLYYFEEKTA